MYLKYHLIKANSFLIIFNKLYYLSSYYYLFKGSYESHFIIWPSLKKGILVYKILDVNVEKFGIIGDNIAPIFKNIHYIN